MRSKHTLSLASGLLVFCALGSLALAACTDVQAVVKPATQTDPSAPTEEVDAGEPLVGDGDGPDAESTPLTGESCAPGGGSGTANDCGEGVSCCASAPLPGGTFYRWKNGANAAPQDEHPATVSAFSLDLFEVTVGRFRRFVEAGGGTRAHPPAQGAGAHPKIPGSGWKSAWNTMLPQDRIALDAAIIAEKPVTLWTQGPGPNEAKPMKGIGYALAFAFCAWDGGRLPTMAEWNFAAMGGDEHRTFPWGSAIGHTRAVYDCRASNADHGCGPADIPTVGSKPDGIGRWGHFDLVGSVKEWALDSDPDLMPCKDCGIVDPAGNWSAVMGGSYWSQEIGDLTSSALVLKQEPTADWETGVRCARDRTP